MDVGFETIGNATLIGYDKKPIIVTDPWIEGSPYFGSWTLSHEIPPAQRDAILQCEYVWVSHGHPDHLNSDSINLLRGKKILLPNHYGGRIHDALKGHGHDVHTLEDKVWHKISDRIHILCLSDFNQDASLFNTFRQIDAKNIDCCAPCCRPAKKQRPLPFEMVSPGIGSRVEKWR